MTKRSRERRKVEVGCIGLVGVEDRASGDVDEEPGAVLVMPVKVPSWLQRGLKSGLGPRGSLAHPFGHRTLVGFDLLLLLLGDSVLKDRDDNRPAIGECKASKDLNFGIRNRLTRFGGSSENLMKLVQAPAG